MALSLNPEWQQFIRNNSVVLATSKLETLFHAWKTTWAMQGTLQLRNPEKAVKPEENEPRSDDPKVATRFKIARLQQEPEVLPEKENTVILATDVVFGIALPGEEPQFFHKLEREPGETVDQHEARLKDILQERYKAPEFQVFWRIAIGAGKKGAASLGTITAETKQTFFTRPEIEKYLLKDSNAGLPMVEMAIGRGVDFLLRLEGEEEPILFDEPQEKDVLRQLIATKSPTREMILDLHATLERAEMQAHPERYSLVNFARTHLLAN